MSEHTAGPWSIGRLLTAPSSKRLTEHQRLQAESEESVRVFANFTEADQGRSRIHVAHCYRDADAAHIVRCVNAHDGLVAALTGLMNAYFLADIMDAKEFARAALDAAGVVL